MKIFIMICALLLATVCAGLGIYHMTIGATFWAVIDIALVAINLNSAWTMWRLL